MMDQDLVNVPDPTDFPPSSLAPGLRDLDAAFRCDICGDVFDAPVVLQCGHTYCSLCIRQSLKERKECPSCRQPMQEYQLVKNAVVEQLGNYWDQARPFVHQLIQQLEQANTRPRPPKSVNGKRKSPDPIDGPRKRRRNHDFRSESSPAEEHASNVISIEDDDEATVDPTELVVSSDVEEQEIELVDSSLVVCPVCSRKVRYNAINTHIDNQCRDIHNSNGGPSKGTSTHAKHAWKEVWQAGTDSGGSSKRKGKGKARDSPEDDERIPKVAYSVLKDKHLREMLEKLQLLTTGNRATLIARHEYYALIHNANLDRKENRKTPAELRRELQRWEERRDLGKPIVQDVRAYEAANKEHFRQLAEAARKTRPTIEVKK